MSRRYWATFDVLVAQLLHTPRPRVTGLGETTAKLVWKSPEKRGRLRSLGGDAVTWRVLSSVRTSSLPRRTASSVWPATSLGETFVQRFPGGELLTGGLRT